jgi:hypothetical protein
MLIRKEQLNSFAEVAKHQFVQALAKFVEQEMPTAVAGMGPDKLVDTVEHHARAASQFGLENESDIAQFVCLSFLPGKPFYQLPEVQGFLRLPNPDAGTKLKILISHLGHQLRTAIRG